MALAVAVRLTGAGLVAAGLADGRRSLVHAGAVATAASAYDLVAKSTPAGPPTMAVARGLDVLLGAGQAGALPGAAVVALHTAVTTTLSGHEAGGATAAAPQRALAGGRHPAMRHLEVETYTWSVLPEDRRPADDAGLVTGLAAELGWARDQLVALGLELL